MMKQTILCLVVFLLAMGLTHALDLEKSMCLLTCKAEHLDWSSWQRDGWCNSKCEASAAWESAKKMFG